MADEVRIAVLMPCYNEEITSSKVIAYCRADLPGADMNVRLARVVEPDSIIFTSTQNSFYRLVIDQRVRIAVPWFDDFRGFQALRKFHAARGRTTYVWLDEDMSEAILEHRLFENLDTVPVFDHPGGGSLVQVIEAPAVPGSASN